MPSTITSATRRGQRSSPDDASVPLSRGHRRRGARSSSRTATSASIASSLICGSGSCWLNFAHSNRSVRRRTRAGARLQLEQRALEVLERRLRRAARQAGPRERPLHPRVRGDDRLAQIRLGAEVVERLVERERDGLLRRAPRGAAPAAAGASGSRPRRRPRRRAGRARPRPRPSAAGRRAVLAARRPGAAAPTGPASAAGAAARACAGPARSRCGRGATRSPPRRRGRASSSDSGGRSRGAGSGAGRATRSVHRPRPGRRAAAKRTIVVKT